MSTLKDSMTSHLEFLDHHTNFVSFTGSTLLELFEPLFKSITDDGAIAYLIEMNKRYRASPLSSSIEWLDSAGLLPLSALKIMQDKLVFLRDNNIDKDEDQGIESKFDEDKFGWSLGEGVSVWSTSTALLALFDKHGLWKTHIPLIKESVLWLVGQRNVHKKGWAYQLHDNCEVNVIMTSLALRAIVKMQLQKDYFCLTAAEDRNILTAINNGLSFLKDALVVDKKRGYSYWEFNSMPNCAATTWSLLAIKDMSNIQGINDESAELFNSIQQNCLRFILSRIPQKDVKWDDEQIVFEGGAKYNKQKNYHSFSVTLLPQLFSLGLSPYHPKIINQMRWILSNPEEWKIINYDRGHICAFTYAMVISTITQWALCVGKTNTAYILIKPDNKIEKICYHIWGVASQKTSPVQIVLSSRLKLGLFILLLIAIGVILGKSTFNVVENIVESLVSLWSNSSHDIAVNVVAGFVYALLAGGLLFLFNKVKSLYRRWRN